ncbi:MAG: tRNA (adenosine(37)-N6)-threonylcarbamoyltransferase complex dimerization subunit type 1 TsaB [Bacteriodetes bacterium]|nr:tRNA (adenosine(37)-N6)-threonylcarbamoyltransferase complex dimerization subunit type 1 TsaB [Bacteroidota bacterium]
MKDKQSTSILSIETSSVTCGVALTVNGALSGEFSLLIPNIHDKALAEMTRSLLAQSNITIQQLDAVAVSAGPGSFTGLRIGINFAKALCFDNTPKLIAIPTLQATASAADEFATMCNADKILVVNSSQRGVYFMQMFDNTANPLSDVKLVEHQDVQQHITSTTVVCGNAAHEFGGLQLSGLNRLTPRFIARLAVRFFEQQKFVDATSFAPSYHQEFVPKVKVTEM